MGHYAEKILNRCPRSGPSHHR